MPAAPYRRNGSYLAIQWTGTNLSDIKTTLGTTVDLYTSATDSSSLVINGSGTGSLSYPAYVPLNYWIVSDVAYPPNTPTFGGVPVVVDPGTFTQQYSPT